MEKIITIEVPETSFKAIEKPFEGGDYPTTIAVNAEVDRVVRALEENGTVSEDDEITVNLKGSKDVKGDDPTRSGTIKTVYREGENGKGAIDSTTEGFTIELSNDVYN